MVVRALLALAARRASAQPRLLRSFHASTVVLARQSRRGGRTVKATSAPASKAFESLDHGDDDDDDEDGGSNGKLKKTVKFFTKDELEENPNLHAQIDDDDDDDELQDEETKKFLKEVDELFTLDPTEFDRRLSKVDADQVDFRGNPSRGAHHDDDNEDGGSSMDDKEEEDFDRAERIPKKRLLRVLDEFDSRKARVGKNAESMPIPKTKATAPLEKKTKKIDPERISHRQERVEGSVSEFVQNLLLEDCAMTEADVFPHIVDSSASPDLRRIVLYWEAARRNSVTNQAIAKKKIEGVQKRLGKLERWIRMSVARHLNLKYSPIIQFKRHKEDEQDKIREVFDQEMAWLERFK